MDDRPGGRRAASRHERRRRRLRVERGHVPPLGPARRADPCDALRSDEPLTKGHWSDLARRVRPRRQLTPLVTVLVVWCTAAVATACINVAEVVFAKHDLGAGNIGLGLPRQRDGGGARDRELLRRVRARSPRDPARLHRRACADGRGLRARVGVTDHRGRRRARGCRDVRVTGLRSSATRSSSSGAHPTRCADGRSPCSCRATTRSWASPWPRGGLLVDQAARGRPGRLPAASTSSRRSSPSSSRGGSGKRPQTRRARAGVRRARTDPGTDGRDRGDAAAQRSSAAGPTLPSWAPRDAHIRAAVESAPVAGRGWTQDELVAGVLAGDRRALARSISLVEDGEPEGAEIVRRIYPSTGRAASIGVTGPPGVGKSSLVGALVAHARASGRSVGVVSVDPSSPFTRGALLGDRIRLADHFLDPGRLHPLDGDARAPRRPRGGDAPGAAARRRLRQGRRVPRDGRDADRARSR